MIKSVAVAVVGLLCFVFIWFCTESRSRRAVRPPEGATNLTAFLLLRPDFDKIQKFTNSHGTYLEILGRAQKRWLSLPSGPPVYVFDESGTLVDWAADLGEASEFNHKWGSLTNATPITVENAKALVNPPK